MGQIGPDITFAELRKQYIDSLKLLDKATTRAETAEAKLGKMVDLLMPRCLIPAYYNQRVEEFAHNLWNRIEAILDEGEEES